MDRLRGRLAPLLRELNVHPVYGSMETIEDLRIFMQSHVFAVWDFMSLLKTLQRRLTCVDVPWVPTAFPRSRRFINEIVLGEESDEYDGRPTSHFELYLEAMEQVEADTSAIRQVVAQAKRGVVEVRGAGVPEAAGKFLEGTFSVIREGSAAAQAAVFAFGREDAIPDMFRALVGSLAKQFEGEMSILIWYLERHIEVDGDDHGPLALEMVADLCAEDEAVWEEAGMAAEAALRARIELWDGVVGEMERARVPLTRVG